MDALNNEAIQQMNITVLSNARVFDGESEDIRDNQSVVIEGDRIREVVDGNTSFDDADHINCGGRFLMPGLIDAHFHAYSPTFDIQSLDRMPMSLLANHASVLLEGALGRGFTSVRDAGGADIGLALAIEGGLFKGPRLFFCGKALSQTGGHGDMRPGDEVEPCFCAYQGALTTVVDGEVEVRKTVRDNLRKGATQIKLFLSGGVLSPTDPVWMPQFSEDEILAAVEEAATRRTYVMAHCHTDDSVRRAAELGIRSIEHGSQISDGTAQLLAEKGSYVVPTLSVVNVLRKFGEDLGAPRKGLDEIPALYTQMLEAIASCRNHGVSIGFGTDLFGSDFHPLQSHEFTLRTEVDQPIDVLRSATSVNAEILNMAGELGCIAPGAYADIILLETNPLDDFSVFETNSQMPLIMKSGKWVRNEL